jgi:hypothetical protein
VVFLLWWMYVFLRGDLFNIGSTLVPVLLLGGVVTIGGRISFSRRDP